mmetsp:Transcript_74485/g.139101  ORF Transcript_74485/g.139101 Transcript_74485/m.139101 type:complete len:315 (+) Transcript_74485:77-1021(+)
MAFVKLVKNRAFFKRFQVKKRRRREGKTDYQARRAMTKQDKTKYASKKYRLVVRFSNKRVICQVVYSTIVGDKTIASATSDELKNYGIPAGYKNYAAAYCTGLLVARRCLKTLSLDETFKGKEELDAEEYHVEEEENDRRPFKCILDVGLRRTCVGCRIWGALKGAVDGGLHVPHSIKKFPGYSAPEEKGGESSYDAEAHKDRIYGNHVKEYMEMLAEEDPTKYEAHFAKYIGDGIDADKMEDMYTEAMEKIRENPDRPEKEAKNITFERDGQTLKPSEGDEYTRCIKLTLKQRKAKVQAKITRAQEKLMAGDD